MKSYYIKYPRNFANEFTICHVERGSAEEKEAIAQGYRRITRREAIAECIAERKCLRDSGYYSAGSTEIYPFGCDRYDRDRLTTSDGYIWERKEVTQ